MPIDRKLMKELKPGFDYLEQYDRLGGRPEKRVPISITVSLHLKRELEAKGKPNVSRFIENTLERAIHRK